MDDLTAFVTARLDEDEAIAKAAIGRDGASWQIGLIWDDSDVHVDHDGVHVAGPLYRETGKHIARHDPARVLRETGVIRSIVTSHHYENGRCDSCEYECPVIALAAIWHDHPDYLQKWST